VSFAIAHSVRQAECTQPYVSIGQREHGRDPVSGQAVANGALSNEPKTVLLVIYCRIAAKSSPRAQLQLLVVAR